MHAAFDGDAIVGGAGAFSLRLTVPGGGVLPCAGHDRRRRPADAPPPRDPPVDDARAPRRRARARRGARGPLGLGGDDLRPLRLRARLAVPAARHRQDAQRVPARVRAGRARAPRRGDRGGNAHAAGLRRRPARHARDVPSAAPSWWEHRILADPPEFRFGASPKHLAVLEVDGEPQAYAIYRLNVSFGDLGPETTLRTLEVMGATPERDRLDLALPARRRLDEDRLGEPPARRPPAAPPARPAQPRAADALATASGSASSTSAPPCPGARTPTTARSCSTSATSSARGTRAAGGSRAARRRGRTRTPTSRSTSPHLGARLPRRLHVPRARRGPAESRSSARARSHARTRCSASTGRAVVPGDLLTL